MRRKWKIKEKSFRFTVYCTTPYQFLSRFYFPFCVRTTFLNYNSVNEVAYIVLHLFWIINEISTRRQTSFVDYLCRRNSALTSSYHDNPYLDLVVSSKIFSNFNYNLRTKPTKKGRLFKAKNYAKSSPFRHWILATKVKKKLKA